MDVSRETAARFDVYVELLQRWQGVKNLVGAATLPEVWTRHVADSFQLVGLGGAACRWADIGSGAGFPGLVIGIALRERPNAHVHLIEANNRKAAFLREVARETGAPVTVHARRIEDVIPELDNIEVLTARALAPLPQLLLWGKRLIEAGTLGLFLKGGDAEHESATVRDDPAYAVELLPSLTQAEARIVRIKAVGTSVVNEARSGHAG
ncbi:16S rRNA (guanine(527)-N(7))-methyltransferase RsmG [Lichenihabitans sp. Uapishka_5]|uniref:16S rRNA (guanine(527)-N(7))-methyltransferase RsmG n=1 Tax=Lichenihabitans sp. Uapishka_5 TaxID=3037302 RepID=UPI0029E7E832|nr:16S rRNA (guanine(527)-N(7))-methyltransferase RsmG [Lichenihabitans sp. Uapishka_5]MDX7952080.1 16S rRNA (guanine(527)-N(7))-methyltransferase RsmG [Lichenihabitans sp. Uapishka_5]